MKRFTQWMYTSLVRLLLIGSLAAVAVGCGSSNSSEDPVVDPDAGTDTGTDAGTDTGTGDETSGVCDDQSKNDSWVDNCLLQRGGLYGNTFYTKGVQRILFCLGINPGGSANINAFADGIFGPNTEAAVMEFQRDRVNIAADGIVGPQTWGKLQELLDQPTPFDTVFESYSVDGLGCGTEIQFYQRINEPFDWRMAETPGSTTMVEFSTTQTP